MSSTELLAIARDVARTAGAFALERRSHGVSVAATKSSPVDVVTEVDRDTETLIRSLLADARPDDGFYGEESDATGGSSGVTWVVDPIDGTVNFLYGIPAWAVSIAAVEGPVDTDEARTLAGAIANPSTGELYWASVGDGAFRDGERLHVTPDVTLDRALVGTGFGYRPEVRLAQAAVLGRLIGQIRDIRRIGSAALDLCDLASGRLDAYYERGLNPWDHAAGGLIAREAGAVVTGRDGLRESSDLFVAGAPGVQAELLAALALADPRG
ncbi:inositol monophosphatase family protein [Agromyces atrinae]|uniref:Inositol-1-monophosphatase n=1 Tax=Agromyces atrinae TaxID=592376 RepID=A0A4Q2M9V2_9MICO|nr:inositol monophosphatase family protein [Agromyces atrinae]NYD67340.1 myo-inositol-1(or 4)-monophosphatase [Agromyces atrinae]RXZ86831.1 inositol monophosphatase [Agromyces atrinae]